MPPVHNDFPTAVLSEAARAINTQKAAKAVLLASARAESPGAGAAGPLAVAALDARFDELVAEAIEFGHVICELDRRGKIIVHRQQGVIAAALGHQRAMHGRIAAKCPGRDEAGFSGQVQTGRVRSQLNLIMLGIACVGSPGGAAPATMLRGIVIVLVGAARPVIHVKATVRGW